MLENEYGEHVSRNKTIELIALARPHTHIRKISDHSPPSDIVKTPSFVASTHGGVSREASTSSRSMGTGARVPYQSHVNHVYAVSGPFVPSQGVNRMAVNAMLNHEPVPSTHDPVPSRVIACDSDYRRPQSNAFYPQAQYQSFPPSGQRQLVTSQPSTPVFRYDIDPHWKPLAPIRPTQTIPTISRTGFNSNYVSNTAPQPMNYTYPNGHSAPSAPTVIRHPSSDRQHAKLHPLGMSTSRQDVAESSRSTHDQPVPRRTSIGVGKIDLGIARMRVIMTLLPPLRVPAIHLAGTNGKGSVSAILESCLLASGLNVARYNSPHLIDSRDAIRFNGLPSTHDEYESAKLHIQLICNSHYIGATTFEVETAAAYLLIIQHQPDIMIIECGMGGIGDATNVIPHDVTLASALTSIGLDHTVFLGDSVAAITEQKAKIAVPEGLLFVAPQTHPDALNMAQRVAYERGSRLVPVKPSTEINPQRNVRVSLRPFELPAPTLIHTLLPANSSTGSANVGHLLTKLSLPGAHQIDNLSLAIMILHVLRQDARALSILPKLARISDQSLQAGVASTKWHGRCSWEQWLHPGLHQPFPILIDGAHNEDSARRLRHYIDSLIIEPRRPVTFIVSLSDSKGKSVRSVLGPLLRPGDSVAAVEFSTPVEGMPWVTPVPWAAVRSVSASLVGDLSRLWSDGGNSTGSQAVEDALRWVTADWDEKGPGLVVVCGSLYLVADVYRLISRQGPNCVR